MLDHILYCNDLHSTTAYVANIHYALLVCSVLSPLPWYVEHSQVVPTIHIITYTTYSSTRS